MNNTIKLIQVEQVKKDIKVYGQEVKENIQNIKTNISYVMVLIRSIYKFIYNSIILIILKVIKFISMILIILRFIKFIIKNKNNEQHKKKDN